MKDDEELELLRRAQAVTDQAFDDILETLAVGMTEQAVARAAGAPAAPRRRRRPQSSSPSWRSARTPPSRTTSPDTALLDEGDVIKLDFGALYGGYHADMTRTVAFGEPATELKKVHDVVRQAQQAGIDAVARRASPAQPSTPPPAP